MRALVLFAFLAVLATVAGCATITKSPEQVKNTYRRSLDLEMKQLAYDWNYIWLAHRPGRLTEWHMR